MGMIPAVRERPAAAAPSPAAISDAVAKALTFTPKGSISTWSHSRMTDFEKCNFSAYLKYVLNIPEPERELPKGKTEHANDRGTRIHTGCETFVNATSDELPVEAEKHFAGEMYLLRHLHGLGMVSLEGEWAFDRDWNPTVWSKRLMTADQKPPWVRMKLDATVFWSPQEATAIDFKSGRKFGNEIKHNEQLTMYQLGLFLRYPDLEYVETELWYFDQDEITKKHFYREQGLRFLKGFDNRGRRITTATEFPTNANKFSCRWCPYLETEHCVVGVRA